MQLPAGGKDVGGVVFACGERQKGAQRAVCSLESKPCKLSSNGLNAPCEVDPVQELYICAKPRWNVFCTTVSRAVHEELQRPLAEVAAVQPALSPAPMMACFHPPPPAKTVL